MSTQKVVVLLDLDVVESLASGGPLQFRAQGKELLRSAAKSAVARIVAHPDREAILEALWKAQDGRDEAERLKLGGMLAYAPWVRERVAAVAGSAVLDTPRPPEWEGFLAGQLIEDAAQLLAVVESIAAVAVKVFHGEEVDRG